MATAPFTIDESIPGDSDIVSQHPSNARTFRDVVESYLNTDHDFNTGHHAAVGLVEQGSDPSNVANTGFIYTKDDGGDTELYYEDDAGNVTKLTEDGTVASAIPSGTKMLFAQDTAPTGWTKVTTASLDESVLRLVTTTTVTTGGDDAFTTVFSSSKATESHTLTTDEIPSHTHTYERPNSPGSQSIGTGPNVPNVNTITSGVATGSTGGGSGHTHDITMDPKFQDVIMATKD